MNLGLYVKLCDLVNLDHLWIILFIFCEVMWITCAPGLVDHLYTWAFLFIVMQNENLGSKKAKAQTRIRPKRLWPKTIVDYKKIHQKKAPFPEIKRPNYWSRPMQIIKIKRKNNEMG